MSVTAAEGFVAGGLSCGIKPAGALDLALVATDDSRPVPAAAVVTANRAKAAPVLTTLAHLAQSGGRAAAVILNSGNANAATGAPGRDTAQATCAAVAEQLSCEVGEVLVCSTGLIGMPLSAVPMVTAMPQLTASLSRDGGPAAAQAILTTDTRTKESVVTADGWTVGAMAKGAAMLCPHMATMLAVVTTDAAVDPVTLQSLLRAGVVNSFNSLVIDGATSTNDTVIVMASGRAGPPTSVEGFSGAIAHVCADLAHQMASDAEGATKRAWIKVSGARTDDEARHAARAVAGSQLIQCSLHGADPYWGRVVSELGACGVAFDPERVSVSYGSTEVCRSGVARIHDAGELAAYMANEEIEVHAELGMGSGHATVLTTDLSPAYIAENMRTS